MAFVVYEYIISVVDIQSEVINEGLVIKTEDPTSDGEGVAENLSPAESQAEVKYENSSTQVKSEPPDVECNFKSEDDGMYIKLEPLEGVELDIKEEFAETKEEIQQDVQVEQSDSASYSYACPDEEHSNNSRASCIKTVSDDGSKQKINNESRVKLGKREKRFKCNICEHRFIHNGTLQRHIKNHKGEKPFKCSVCEYRCSVKGNLGIHLKIHTGVKPFKCDLCEYRTSRKGDLKSHSIIHLGMKPFECSICQYKCSKKSYLRQHLETHTGEKPFQCNVCKYRFLRRRCLTRHMRVHTGEKPFTCNICERKFREKCDLQNHVRRQKCTKPFKCNLCIYTTSDNCRFLHHMKTHADEKLFQSNQHT